MYVVASIYVASVDRLLCAGVPAARFLLDRIQASASDERAAANSAGLSQSREFQAEEFCKVVGLSALIEAKSCSEDVVLNCIYEVG